MDNVDLRGLRAARLILDMEQSALAYKLARKSAAREEAFRAWRKALQDLAGMPKMPGHEASGASAAPSVRQFEPLSAPAAPNSSQTGTERLSGSAS